MDISSAEANAELPGIKSEAELRALISRLDVQAQGSVTVLYSGRLAPEIASTEIISGMLSAGEDVRVLDKTEAFKFLDVYSERSRNQQLIETLERVFESDPLESGTKANQFLFGTIGPDGKRIADGAWDIVSAKFAAETVGEVRTITSFAQPDRVFGASELPRVLANERVTTIEDIDRISLANLQADRGGNAAFEAVQARSYENVGKLNVAVNDAGKPLYSDAGQLLIDSRAYFTGTALTAQPPAFTVVTRPLADRMAPPSDFAQAGMRHLDALRAPSPDSSPANLLSAPRSTITRTLDALDDKIANAASGKTRIRLDADGLPYDDVPHDIASREQLQSYDRAAAQMREFKVPALWDRNDRHSYMLFGLLDGTGNDVDRDPLHATNVAKLREQIRDLRRDGLTNVDFVYRAGPGTQTNLIENTVDGALGRTSLARAEDMYAELAERINQILKADPQARISIHLEGFSRGASTVPLLARMIHERGFPDPSSAIESLDEHGNTVRTYTRHHITPGQVPMSVGLYDPVPTGYLEDFFDRRLPPSVVSGFQINAADEQRGLFPVDRIIPEGHSADKRFLSVTVAGAHSDLAGSYFRSGLGDRSLNLMTDFRNALTGEPIFQRVPETIDPRMDVIHHSTEGNALFRHWPKIDRSTPAGEVKQLVPDYTHIVRPGQVVHTPEQAPEPASEMTQRLQTLARPVERTPHVGPPEQAGVEGLMARLSREAKVELLPYEPEAIERARIRRAAVGGVLLEVGLTGYEWAQTHQRAEVFKNTLGNETAGNDAYLRQGAQTAGAVVGAAAATTTAAALGTGTGGTALLVLGEAYLFGTAAERAVDWWQQYGITNIASEGVNWKYTGKQWIRQDLRGDLLDDGRDIPQEQSFAAPPDKHRELSALASAKAVELAIAKVPEPIDPFVQPANAQDRSSLGQTPANWTYKADSGEWERWIVTKLDNERMPVDVERTVADPERAAQLSAQAVRVIDANLRASSAEIAAQYQRGHKAYGYDQTPSPADTMPAAVTTALDPDLRQASDGKHYRRDTQGTWIHDGAPADAQRALELELTRDRMLPALQDHQRELARMPSWQPPTPEQADRALLRTAYLDHDINREIRPELFEASYLAVQRTRAAAGIGPDNTVTVLGTDESGQYSPDSPIHHIHRNADGVVRIVAVTTPEDINRALADVRARTEDTPYPAPFERAVALATPEERGAREQAAREANRLGLSQEQTQETVQAATLAVASRGMTMENGAVRAIQGEPERTHRPERMPEDAVTQEVPLVATAALALAQSAHEDGASRLERERMEAESNTPQQGGADETQVLDEDRRTSMRTIGHDGTPATSATPERQPDSLTPRSDDIPPQQTRVDAAEKPTGPDSNALRLGDRGDSVELLQYRLDRQGYRGPDGEQIPQNGRYGPETEHAIRQFQTMHGIPATGVADQGTRDAVDQALAAQRERERAEQATPIRSLLIDPKSEPDAPQPVIAPRSVSPSISGGRSVEDDKEREPEPVVRIDAPSTLIIATTPDPALIRPPSMRDEREEDHKPTDDQRHGHTPTSEPASSAGPLVTEPKHAAHGMYLRAQNVLSQIEVAPGMGGLTQHERQKLGASVVAMSLAAEGWNITSYDHIVPGKVNPQTGRPDTLFVVQGSLDDPAHRRVPINVEQALSQSLEQSSVVSQAVMQAREHAMEQAQQIAMQQDDDGPKGPTMRMGARSMSPAQGPQGDGGGGDGGGGGGG